MSGVGQEVSDGGVKNQLKEPTHRTILANALETTIDISTPEGKYQLQYLTEYKGHIAEIEDLEAHLAEVKTELKELSFAKGKRDMARIDELQRDKNRTQTKLNRLDRRLTELDSMKPIRDLLARKKKSARKKAEKAGRELARERVTQDREKRSAKIYKDRIEAIVKSLRNRLTLEGRSLDKDDAAIVIKRYTKKPIAISTQSIKHGLGGKSSYFLTNARMGMIIGEIVQNGIPLNELNPSDGTDSTYAIGAYVTSPEGRDFLAIAHIDVSSNNLISLGTEDLVHSLRGRIKKGSPVAIKSAPASAENHLTVVASNISIAQFLEFVNSTNESDGKTIFLTMAKWQHPRIRGRINCIFPYLIGVLL